MATSETSPASAQFGQPGMDPPQQQQHHPLIARTESSSSSNHHAPPPPHIQPQVYHQYAGQGPPVAELEVENHQHHNHYTDQNGYQLEGQSVVPVDPNYQYAAASQANFAAAGKMGHMMTGHPHQQLPSATSSRPPPYNPVIITNRISRIPPDKINLRLILVTGLTKEFLFSPCDSASFIAQFVYDNWPEGIASLRDEWSIEGVSRAEVLRLIYQGRFLHGNVTLGALQLPLGRTSVMHLVPRENLPEPNSQDPRLKSKERTTGCCSTSCSIL